MYPTHIDLTVPDWLSEELGKLPSHLPTIEERMRAVIKFSRLNVERDTGGPFAAGVFERQTGKVLVIGVNRVVPNSCSSAHAEVMTISLAQKMLGVFDLGGPGLPEYELVVNWRPCVMCYGAVIWSGVRSLVIAGDGAEVERLTGFDEGPLRDDWVEQLNVRGIDVTNHVLEDEACDVFKLFGESGRIVYKPRGG